MPIRPKSIQPPWIVKQDYNVAGQGRRILNPFYHTPTWRKVRAAHIAREPLCRECSNLGITNTGNIVDHIRQINPVNAWDTQDGKYGEPIAQENLQTLCTYHHNVKSGKERHNK